MTSITTAIGDDGFYHPESEQEIVALVKKAAAENLQIRCRGSAHSLSHAIYTDPGKGESQLPNIVSEEKPPKGPNINIMFDKYIGLTWIDEANGIVEVEAGIHLGIDPNDPTGTSTLENGLLYQAFEKGFTLSDLGGISHQTISGFLMTGSSGGTVWYTIEENILALSMIDGRGEVEWFSKDDENFGAIVLSLGLLGIVSKVRLKLAPNYYVYGQQITYPVDAAACPIDLFGQGTGDKPGLETYLRKTPYSRILWWPQKGVERVVIWQAVRGDDMPIFDTAPYKEFADSGFMTNLEELAAAVLFTMLGNTKFWSIWNKLKPSFDSFSDNTNNLWGNSFLSWLFTGILTFLLKVIFFILIFLLFMAKGLLKKLYPPILRALQPLTEKGKGQLFMDYMYNSLPMDNEASDIMMDTEFTELWVPIQYTTQAMVLLDKIFKQYGIAATSYYSTELYTAKKSAYWLSPAYGTDVFRIDFFWYKNNEGNPGEKGGFFARYWDALSQEKIPFRLHWGKFLPEYDYEKWANYLRGQYPRWDDFMKLRELRDPQNIFLTDYWSRHLFGKNL